MFYIGIDVAKNKHDCCILKHNLEEVSLFTFTNDKAGFDKLMLEISRFSKETHFSDIKIGLESTGHYSTNLTNYLLQKRLSVKIYNPLLVSLKVKADSLRKTKTDKSDCRFLARLTMTEESKPYIQPVSSVSELKILTRNRHRLVAQRSKLKLSLSRLVTIVFPELPELVYSVNQKSSYALLLEYPTASAIANAHLTKLTNVLHSNSKGKYTRDKALEIRKVAENSIGFNSFATGFELQQTIRLIQNVSLEISLLDNKIKEIMSEIDSPILSIPGIGYVLGAIILSEIGDVRNFQNPAKLLKFAGLEPSVYESGKFKASSTSIVKRGSKYLRWALLQATRLVAIRDETFKAYMAKKISEGKHFFVAQGHVSKKLVRVIFSLLKNSTPFQPSSILAT